MVSAYDAPPLEPLSGDASRLSTTATRYQGVAEQIQQITQQLIGIADREQSVGQAADAVRGQALAVADAVDRVVPRYSTAAEALLDYAVALSDAQDEAGRAAAAAESERSALWPLYVELDETQYELQGAGDDARIEELTDRLDRVRAEISDHEGALDDQIARYWDADSAKDSAAHAAADRILPVLEELNDGVLDNVGGVLDDIADFAGGVARWVSEVLETILAALAVIVIALVVIALALVVIVVLGAMLALVPALQLALAAGVLTPDQLLDGFLATALAILPTLNIFLATVLSIEALKPTPPMRFTGTQRVPTTSPEDGHEYTPYEQALLHAGLVDSKGGSDTTQVQVIRVGTDTDGKPIWRVVVPSTQDWEGYGFGADGGAANDLGSNLTLMLSPAQQAAYERMVLDAMGQAGIGPDDHVMMVGWSQGGILAGELAADPSTPYNIEAIVVAGAPIDHMDIPDDVSVVAIQHEGDPVHRLDGQAPPPTSSSWVTVETDPYDPDDPDAGPEDNGPLHMDPGQHGSNPYANTAAALDNGDLSGKGYIDPATAAAFEDVSAQQAKFFGENEYAYVYEGAEEF
jgi:hypothetical protein